MDSQYVHRHVHAHHAHTLKPNNIDTYAHKHTQDTPVWLDSVEASEGNSNAIARTGGTPVSYATREYE